jgi:hypothetical protein
MAPIRAGFTFIDFQRRVGEASVVLDLAAQLADLMPSSANSRADN